MKKLLLVIGVLLLSGGAFFGYQMLYPKPMPKLVDTTPETPMIYTLEQVAEHNNKDSCWMVIDGKVYDVTPFVISGFHPGKDAILAGCGLDATELFNTRPMGSKTPHSDKARGSLPKYVIGDLARN